MAEARDVVLKGVRAALGTATVIPDVPRRYRLAAGAPGASGDVDLFCERVAEYGAAVRRTSHAALAEIVRAACAAAEARRVVAVGYELEIRDVETLTDTPPLTPSQLEGIDGVVTGCALAVAETGTIVLDGGTQSGRRALTLVPDLHVCIVLADQIVGSVPEAIAGLEPAARAGQPITFISGPSATSDIELRRVAGVHGPRALDVVVVA